MATQRLAAQPFKLTPTPANKHARQPCKQCPLQRTTAYTLRPRATQCFALADTLHRAEEQGDAMAAMEALTEVRLRQLARCEQFFRRLPLPQHALQAFKSAQAALAATAACLYPCLYVSLCTLCTARSNRHDKRSTLCVPARLSELVRTHLRLHSHFCTTVSKRTTQRHCIHAGAAPARGAVG